MNEVIVIGGGVVGSSAAYRLARAGATVTLIDRSDPGQATAAGAGIVAPGTSLSMPRDLYTLSANAAAYYPLMSADLAEDGERDIGYATVGCLFVATTDEEDARLESIVRLAESQRSTGVEGIGDVSRLDSRVAHELFPPLADVAGAVYIAGSARVDGRLLREALRRAAQRHGARMVEGNAQLAAHGNRVTHGAHVELSGQTLSCDAVILAAGAWTASLIEAIDQPLPVYPQRGQILHMEMAADTARWPIVQGFHSHYLLAFPGGRVVAGATREDTSGFDARVTTGGIHEVTREALRLAPGLAAGNLVEIRVGLRPASPDGLPILGRLPSLENVYVATGHGPMGLTLGPYSGALVADLAIGKTSSIDLSPFQPERFGPTG